MITFNKNGSTLTIFHNGVSVFSFDLVVDCSEAEIEAAVKTCIEGVDFSGEFKQSQRKAVMNIALELM